MIHRSFLFWALLLWGADALLQAVFPMLRLVADPLLLLLAFAASRPSPHRLFWLQGVGLGLLKDFSTGATLGGWACVFGMAGAIIGSGSRMVELDDPLAVGFWVAVLHLVTTALYALLLAVADPMMRGFHLPWMWLPLSMPANGALAMWGFPRLQRLLKRRAPSF